MSRSVKHFKRICACKPTVCMCTKIVFWVSCCQWQLATISHKKCIFSHCYVTKENAQHSVKILCVLLLAWPYAIIDNNLVMLREKMPAKCSSLLHLRILDTSIHFIPHTKFGTFFHLNLIIFEFSIPIFSCLNKCFFLFHFRYATDIP